MKAVKILEHKIVIRLFGVALFLSPFFNTWISLWVKTEIPNRWTAAVFLQTAHNWRPAYQFLSAASILIGLIMLSGSIKAWRAVLVLLAAFIILQLPDLGHNVRQNWLFAVFFLMNVFAFFFIADQIVWKVRSPALGKKLAPKKVVEKKAAPQKPVVASATVAKPAPMPASTVLAKAPITPPPPAKKVSVTKTPTIARVLPKVAAKVAARKPKTGQKIAVHFEGFGLWARLRGISARGIELQCLHEPPFELTSRQIEIRLKNGLTLRTRLARKSDEAFFFEYDQLKPDEIKLLNQWVMEHAA